MTGTFFSLKKRMIHSLSSIKLAFHFAVGFYSFKERLVGILGKWESPCQNGGAKTCDHHKEPFDKFFSHLRGNGQIEE